MRVDNRKNDELRPVKITPNVTTYAEGSCMVEFGHTRVLCTASVESSLPKWLANSGQGWVSAEYGMLPRSTHTRIRRDRAANSGRTQEISRLIGRSLRAGIDLTQLGERQITVDCDVLQADGGTRTAAVTGGFVALALALECMQDEGMIHQIPLRHYIAAISVGIQDGQALLDLCYEEDSRIGTDMNFVMTEDQRFIEIQGTAESEAFSRDELVDMMALADKGCRELMKVQEEVIGDFYRLNNKK